MAIYFKISDLNISGEAIPEKIADKILEHHIIPMSRVQEKTPFMVYPSFSVKGQPSGFRSYWWEIARGRGGGSQHCFGQKKSGVVYENELGAVDWTCEDFDENKESLLEHIINETNYIRMAVYNTFIHCDYKDTNQGKRLLFDSDSSSNWNFIKFV